MKIITVFIILTAIFFLLLPILSGSTTTPTSVSATEVGVFIGGITGYWIEVVKVAYGSL
ncbi:hypothetical protein KAW18_02615 [candidate division WOR-3 bacterium]|nr:hypothetical protein [candidate division WOR-3 bacterium]